MLKILFILIFVLLQGNCKIYQVVSMFRHGARYYLNKYYDWNTTNWGELSAVGMRQHQKLGQMLKRDYIDRHVMPDMFDEKQMQIYTTDLNRTFTSALSQLFGMYPLGKGPKLPKVDQKYHIPPYSSSQDASDQQFALPKGYQPIPVATNASVIMLSCPRSSIQMQKNVDAQIEVYRQMNMTYFPFTKRMAAMFNFSTLTLEAVDGLHDSIVVDKYLGKPLPDGFTDEDYRNIQHITVWLGLFRINFDLAKAFNTNVIKRTLQDFDGRINNLNTQQLKWTALSFHDTNINCLLNSLNISSAACIEDLYRKGKTTALNCQPGPEFAANIIIELQSDNDKDFYVKVRYNGKYVYLCEKKSTICDYKEWKRRVQPIMIPNAYQICNGKGEGTDKGLDATQFVSL